MSSKDKFGDKLKDKEKAEEDRYFAQKDRERLDAIREADQPPAPKGLCPRCGVALAERDHSGVAIDECADCGGIWLDKGELESIEERDGEGWMSRWVRSLLEGRG
ncbi:MAG: zf-TFIIB domain-containing protein [bacterium]|jgi:hypothetical protein